MAKLQELNALLKQKEHTLSVTKAQIQDLLKEIENEELRLKHGKICGFRSGNFGGDGGYFSYPTEFTCVVCCKKIAARPVLEGQAIKEFACQ
jgi:hypothetical protein